MILTKLFVYFNYKITNWSTKTILQLFYAYFNQESILDLQLKREKAKGG